MKKTYFGLSKTAITICIGIPCIIMILDFIYSGVLNPFSTLFLIIIMICFAKLIKFIIAKTRKK